MYRAAISSSCEVCSGTDRVIVHKSLNVGRCRTCRLVSIIDKPAAQELRPLYSSTSGYEEYVKAQRTASLDTRYTEALDSIQFLLSGRSGNQVLFDVGAGAGAFLKRAADHGFDVEGNEISEPAIKLCFERHNIRLSEQSIEDQAGRDRFDAMTMWCVLAHVRDPREALSAAFRLLKPGGVLYFHTPRWCMIDSAGLALSRLSRGRIRHITRRRINATHMRLYNVKNLTLLVTSVGFELVDLRPRAAYSLETQAYLQSMHFPQAFHKPLARLLDQFVERDFFPRNILDVYLRKPPTLI